MTKPLRALYSLHAVLAFLIVVLLLFCPVLIAAPFLWLRRQIGRLTVRAWLAAIGVPLRVRGLEHLPPGPCVVVCNHASYVDGIVLTAALPSRFTFLVQHGAADWPYIGLIIRRMGVYFVNREAPRAAARAVRGLLRLLQGGGALAVFPEGGFRAEPGLMPFREGAFYLAARTGLPLVPVVMTGTRRLYPDGARELRWSRIEIEVLPALSAAGPARADARRLRDQAYRALAPRVREPSLAPADQDAGETPLEA